MKQVINCSTNTITNAQVDNNKFYGIQQKKYRGNDLGRKGFIQRQSYNSGNYRLSSIDGITRGNMWDTPRWQHNDLSILIRVLNDDPQGFNVYEFNTANELFTWATYVGNK